MLVASLLLIGALVVALAYWQLVVAEGAYLGTRVVALTYDLTATRYDDIKQYNPDHEAIFVGGPLASALDGLAAPFVLDVGTGTGRLPLALFEQPVFNGRMIAVDASRRMLRVATEKLAPFRGRIDLLWTDAAILPFSDATFDAVTCMEMLEFTPDPVAQLDELVRVLRPAGLLLTTRRRGVDARLMPGKTHTRERFRAILESLGLEEVQVQPWQMDYDLAWAMRSGQPLAGMGGSRPLEEVLRCPACRAVSFAPEGQHLMCVACGRRFRREAGMIELGHVAPGAKGNERRIT